MGFVKAYETVRMSGTLEATASKVVSVESVASIRELDRFPVARDGFLAQWIAAPNRAWRTDTGYAVVRECRQGQKVGPLFADELDDALELLRPVKGAVQIDVPAGQAEFLGRLESMGFVSGFRTARMYRGPAPDVEMSRVFGITSLELG